MIRGENEAMHKSSVNDQSSAINELLTKDNARLKKENDSLKEQINNYKHRQPNVMVACAQAHVAQAMDCIVVLYPKVGKCNQTNDTYRPFALTSQILRVSSRCSLTISVRVQQPHTAQE